VFRSLENAVDNSPAARSALYLKALSVRQAQERGTGRLDHLSRRATPMLFGDGRLINIGHSGPHTTLARRPAVRTRRCSETRPRWLGAWDQIGDLASAGLGEIPKGLEGLSPFLERRPEGRRIKLPQVFLTLDQEFELQPRVRTGPLGGQQAHFPGRPQRVDAKPVENYPRPRGKVKFSPDSGRGPGLRKANWPAPAWSQVAPLLAGVIASGACFAQRQVRAPLQIPQGPAWRAATSLRGLRANSGDHLDANAGLAWPF
jgi:hypothetical protein